MDYLLSFLQINEILFHTTASMRLLVQAFSHHPIRAVNLRLCLGARPAMREKQMG